MRPRRKPLIVLLVKRTVLFLSVVCALIIFLYAIGTVQEFLDSTQIGLLRAASSLGLLVAAGAAYGCVLDVWAAVALRNRRFLLGSGAYLLTAALGLAAAAFASGLLAVIAGNLS